MRKKILVVGILSVIYILIFPFVKERFIDAKYIILIETAGERNEQSGGTEVWIDSITKDGQPVELNTVPLSEGWENRGRLFQSGAEVTKWPIRVKSHKQTTIIFVTHPYSGIITITDHKGNTATIDLYSPEQGTYEYTLKY